MTALTVAVTIITVIVLIQSLLLFGLVRSVRALNASGEDSELTVTPLPGHILSSDGMPDELARTASLPLVGPALTVLLTSRCKACTNAIRALAGEGRDAPVPMTILFEEDESTDAEKRAALALLPPEINVVITRERLDTFAGLGPPDGFPVFIVTYNSVVVHSSFAATEALHAARQVASTSQ